LTENDLKKVTNQYKRIAIRTFWRDWVYRPVQKTQWRK